MLMGIRVATGAHKEYHNCNWDSSQSDTIKHDAVETLSSTPGMPSQNKNVFRRV
jgi:hypothetical protein